MRLSFVACLVLPLSVLACSGGDKDDASDSGAAADDGTGGTGDGADGGDGTGDGSSDCPDAVPEQYRNIWDCSTEACGAPVLYRYGIGSSSADGSISMEETIFFFEAPGVWCSDTFVIEGDYSPIDPTTFNCSECEEIWDVTYTMSTGNSCGLQWGSLFKERSDSVEGPFYAMMMFETHGALTGRNEDNAMQVNACTTDSATGSCQPNRDYAEGTATPTTSEDTWPHDYEYASAPLCTARSSAAPQVVDLDTEAYDRMMKQLSGLR